MLVHSGRFKTPASRVVTRCSESLNDYTIMLSAGNRIIQDKTPKVNH